MKWVYDNPPAGYLEEQEGIRVQMEAAKRRAETRAETAKAASGIQKAASGVQKAAAHPEPRDDASGAERHNPGRQSKDDANLKIVGVHQFGSHKAWCNCAVTFLTPACVMCSQRSALAASGMLYQPATEKGVLSFVLLPREEEAC